MTGNQTAANRARARAMFDAAVAAAEPKRAVARALDSAPIGPVGAGGRVFLVAIGKAAVAMTEATVARLKPGTRFCALVVTNPENRRDLRGAEVIAGDHPLPGAASFAAGARVAAFLRRAGAQDRVVALISGGGSALACAPRAGISRADKIALNERLLAGGYAIKEVNLVRQQFSALKGGGMARLAAPAPVATYVLSDVIGDDVRAIASGPTVAPLGSAAEARAILAARGDLEALPAAIGETLAAAGAAAPLPPGNAAPPVLVGSNALSVAAAAKAAQGLAVETAAEPLTGDVADAADAVIAMARARSGKGPLALVLGGETTVRLGGHGRGGRNQELALRVALLAADLPVGWVFLSGGTDGRDGPTDAAGGVVDGGTIARIGAAGLDPAARLGDNDSHAALAAARDLLITGPTGTNVADIQILILP